MRHLSGNALSILLISVGALLQIHGQTELEKESSEWRVEGRVIDAHTREAISGATVFLFREDTRSTESTAKTDGEGRFVLKGTDTGNLRLFGDAPGHLRTEYGSTGLDFGKTIALWPRRQLAGLELTLSRGAEIRGKIVNHDTLEPIPECAVVALRPGIFRGLQRNIAVAGSKSVEDGTFAIQTLAAGDYKVQVKCSDRKSSNQVVAYYPNANDDAGATVISVARGIDVYVGTVKIEWPTADPPVRGKVLLDSREYKNLTIDLYSRSDLIPSVSGKLICVLEGRDQFSCRGVPPGQYHLFATWWFPETQDPMRSVQTVSVGSEPIQVVLGPAPVVPVRLELDPPPKQDGSGKPEVNQETPTAKILFASRDGYWNAGPSTCKIHETCPIVLTPGAYRVHVQGLPQGYFVSSVSVGRSVQSDPLTVVVGPEGSPGDVVIAVRQDGAQVAGKLTNSQGEPIPNRQVALIPKADSLKFVYYQFSTPTSAGQFSFQSVPPGLYELRETASVGAEAVFARDAVVLATVSVKPKDLLWAVYTVPQ